MSVHHCLLTNLTLLALQLLLQEYRFVLVEVGGRRLQEVLELLPLCKYARPFVFLSINYCFQYLTKTIKLVELSWLACTHPG